MRIAFYSPQTSHLKQGLERGGDPIFLHDLFAELRRRGHQLEVISNLNVRQLWRGDVPARSLFTEAIAVRRKVKEFRPDAWLVYNPSRGHPDLFGWWQRPRRYVLLGASTHQSRRMRQPWRLFLAWSHRRSLRRADWVTAARPKTAERLRRHGVPAERLSVLPPAVAAREHVPTQGEARRRLDLPLAEPLILCVSRFTPVGSTQQKTEIVLQLLASLGSLREKPLVVIVGDGPGRAEIEERASEIRPEGRVRLFPAVPNADLVWFYAACDLYAYPDMIDLPRLSIIEAQACGRPVLTIRTPSAELTVADRQTGILADDMADFGRQLASLAGDTARCERMGRAAKEYFTNCHSINTRAEQIERAMRVA